METKSGLPCDFLFDCLIGEASPAERTAFERHMAGCPACSRQWHEMMEVWSSLPETMESVEPAPGLKAEVMRSIFGSDWIDRKEAREAREAATRPNMPVQAVAHQTAPASTGPAGPLRRKKYVWGVTAAAVLLAACVWLYASRGSGFVVNAVEQPLYVEQTYVLNPYDQAQTDAYGTGWIVCQGSKKKLVLNTSGLAATSDEQAYQVWLIHDGKRQNAGTFWVDPKGNGVLVYDLPRRGVAIDAIGITLEPDSRGTEPRGRKVLGN